MSLVVYNDNTLYADTSGMHFAVLSTIPTGTHTITKMARSQDSRIALGLTGDNVDTYTKKGSLATALLCSAISDFLMSGDIQGGKKHLPESISSVLDKHPIAFIGMSTKHTFIIDSDTTRRSTSDETRFFSLIDPTDTNFLGSSRTMFGLFFYNLYASTAIDQRIVMSMESAARYDTINYVTPIESCCRHQLRPFNEVPKKR